MKVFTDTIETKQFKPIELTVRFETPDEARSFRALLGGLRPSHINDAVSTGALYARTGVTAESAQATKRALDEALFRALQEQGEYR